MNTNEPVHRAARVVSDLHDRFCERVDALSETDEPPTAAMRASVESLSREVWLECDTARRSLLLLPWDETVMELLAAVERTHDAALHLVRGLRDQPPHGSQLGDATDSQLRDA